MSVDVQLSEPVSPRGRWQLTGRSAHRQIRPVNVPISRLITAGLWLLVLGWPLLAARLAVHSTGPAPQAAGPTAFPRALDDRAAQFLRLWLAAGDETEDTLAGWLPTVPDLRGVHPGSITADWINTASITHELSGMDYAVLLSAQLTAHPAGKAPTGLGVRCYQVLLTATGNGYSPTQLPAQTSCPNPSTAAAARAAGTLPLTGANGSVPDTVAHWLSAYLTGAGELTRYTTPGISLPAPKPAGATAVTLTALDQLTGDPTARSTPADGETVHVVATVLATDHSGVTTALSYPLTLTARAARWEVTALDDTAHPVTATAPK